MPRPVLISLPLVEAADRYNDLLAAVCCDGVVTPEEQRQLMRVFRTLSRKAERLHDSLRFADMAIHGDGIDGAWFERKRKEDLRDRRYLRVVTPEDDGPDSPAPVWQKAA